MFRKKTKELAIKNTQVKPLIPNLATCRCMSDVAGYYDPVLDIGYVGILWIGGTRTDVVLFKENNYQTQVLSPDGVWLSISIHKTNGDVVDFNIWSVE